MANIVKTAELKANIQEILKGADLDTLSAKKVRRKLEEKFDVDFTERKEEIDKLVMKCITDSNQKEEGTETSQESSPVKRKSNNKTNGKQKPVQNGSHSEDSDKEKSDSDGSLSEDDLTPEEREPQRKKKKSTDSPKVSKDDAELARQLQEEEDNGSGRARRRGTRKPPPPKKKKDDTEKKKKGTSTYSKPCRLSPELAEVLGAEQMARHEIVKRMWAVVKERELMDPKNKQYMICDTQLQKIFGKKRVRTFGMMKWLNNHIIKDGELL